MSHATLHTHQATADPTRTKTLRRAFVAKMRKRFRWLRGIIRTAVENNDVFGLKQNVDFSNLPIPPEGSYDFPRDDRKVDVFMKWLKEQEDRGILDISAGLTRETATRTEWANIYIDSAYKQGMRRAQSELMAAGYNVAEPTDELISFAFGQKTHADAVGLLYTRVFQELSGITSAMDQQISRVLAEGLSAGKPPHQMAKDMTDVVDGIQRKRAEVLARTEVIRAHHRATINMYRQAQVTGVKVRAEWSTAGDLRVCPICEEMSDQGPYSLDEIEFMIPAHPQCRCVALPLTPDEYEETQNE